MKTRSQGVRIPWELYNLVCAAEPDMSFNDIVVCALKKVYSFSCAAADSNSDVCTDFDIDVDIDTRIDNLFERCAREG